MIEGVCWCVSLCHSVTPGVDEGWESIDLQPELDHLPLPSDIVDAVASKTP